jgi:hypothetical protein
MRRMFGLALLGLLAPGAAAAECAMRYDVFETTIPHLDLVSCPGDLAADGRFCRIAMALHGVAVFQFEEAGDRCLVDVVRLEEDEVQLELTPRS